MFRAGLLHIIRRCCCVYTAVGLRHVFMLTGRVPILPTASQHKSMTYTYTNYCIHTVVDSSWNVMAHGDAREGKWRGNWRMEWVASTLHTTSEHGVSSITTADAHTSAASSRLNWRPPADLNELVLFAERRNLVYARVPSHFNWPLPHDDEQ